MDNQKKPQNPGQNDDWLDEILGKQNVPKELGPDELAVAAAGLTHPDELDLDRIVQETLAETAKDPLPEPQPTQHIDLSGEDVFRNEEKKEVPTQPASPEQEVLPDTELDEPNPRKFRPKAKNGYGLWGIPHILSTALWILMVLFIGVSIGRLAWVCAADLLALGKEPISASITIGADEDIASVSQKLQKAGLIRYASLFETFAKITGKADNMLTGTISFNIGTEKPLVYDYNALANALTYRGGASVAVEVMIPEGYNCAQIFELLEKNGVCDADELEAYVVKLSLGTDKESQAALEAIQNKSESQRTKAENILAKATVPEQREFEAARKEMITEYWFLQGVKFGHEYALEGFLFPDTYEFYLDSDAEDVILKLLDGFDYRFSPDMVDQYVKLNSKLGTNFSLYQIITLASIVEKESANPDESYNIASVFYNRLRNRSEFPCLNSDATIIYDTDYRSKGLLTSNDAINASAYNTYTQAGLPPTPISNPGMSTLKAVLDPADTGYYFFIFDKANGIHQFSNTYAEHQQWADRLGY